MKIIVVLFALSMLVLGSCEEVIIERIITDTVFVDRPRTLAPQIIQTTVVDTVYRELVRVDTVEVTIVIRDTIVNEVIKHDTVYQVKTDSVFIERVIEKTINHYDTVFIQQVINHFDTIYIDKIVTIHDTVQVIEYEHEVVYADTFFIIDMFKPMNFIPEELFPFVQSFVTEATNRGVFLSGGPLIVQYVNEEDLPGEGWNSTSYRISQQNVIMVNANIATELLMTPVFREMARCEMSKKYTNNPDEIMNVLFPPERLTMASPQSEKERYFSKLFTK